MTKCVTGSNGEVFRSEEDRLQPVRDVLYGTEITPWDYIALQLWLYLPLGLTSGKTVLATDTPPKLLVIL